MDESHHTAKTFTDITYFVWGTNLALEVWTNPETQLAEVQRE